MDKIKGQIEYDGPLEIEAYLRKMRIKNRDQKQERTPLKFFRISLKDKKLSYKNHKSLNTWRMEIPLNEFIRFIPNLGSEHRGLCEFRYGFQLLTRHKYFVLFCEEEMFNYDWVKMLEYIVNKRELTYDNYEKFIVTQANRDYEAYYNENKNNNEENKEDEFSFSHHLIKEDGDIIEDSDMFYGNNLSNNNTNKNNFNQNKSSNTPGSNFQLPETLNKNNENNNIYGSFQFQSFKNINNNDINYNYLNSNKNNNSLSKDEPVLVDTRKSKPIHDLNKYKIQKDQITIQSSTSRNNIPTDFINKSNVPNTTKGDLFKNERSYQNYSGRDDENDKKNLNNSRNNNKKTPKMETETLKENENSIYLMNDKDEIDDFLNFDFDQLNISKSYRTKADNVIPIQMPIEPPNKTVETNLNNNVNNPNSGNLNNTRTSSNNIKQDEYIFDPYKDFLNEENINLKNSLNFGRTLSNNFNNSITNNNNIVPLKTESKKSHSKNSNSISNKSDLNPQETNKQRIPTKNEYSTPNPLDTYSKSNTQTQIPTPKSNNQQNSFSTSKNVNSFPVPNNSNNYSNPIKQNPYPTPIQQNLNTPKSQTAFSNLTQQNHQPNPNNPNPFPTTSTYIPKKISTNKAVNYQDSLNSQSSSSSSKYNNSQNSDRIGNFTILSTSSTNPQPGKKDPMYDYSHMHIKQDIKKDRVNLENLHFGIDDYKKDIDKITNPVIGSLQLNNIRKTGSSEESVIMENMIKKKVSGLKKKLTPEDSLIVLRNIKKAPTNDNVILEESLKEEGNTWVLNVKIKKNEKI